MATKKAKAPFKATELDGPVSGYCVKCRKKNAKVTDPVLVPIYMKKRNEYKPAIQGTHKCGTKMTVFVGQDFVDEVFESGEAR